MDIDLGALLVFRHLAQTGSFTETGRHWRISQPAVSLMISRLESYAGLVLLERSNAGTRLTPDGSQFLQQVSEVCEAYGGFIEGVHHLGRRMDREVLVAVDRSWFATRMHDHFSDQPTDPPNVGTKFCDVRGNWAAALESGQYDVVLASRFLRAGLTPGIQEAVIRRERGITVAWNADFYPFDPHSFNFPEILRTSVLLPDTSVVCGFAAHLELWCEHAYGMQPAHTVPFASEIEAATAAAAGLGVFLAPGDAIPRLATAAAGLTHVRIFEFLLPDAYAAGIYCRIDEHAKDVLAVATGIGKAAFRVCAPP